jgi:protein-S-isoprenylcysteine O-methyltransferase Ste14
MAVMGWLSALGPRGEGWVVGQAALIGLVGVLGLPGLMDLPPMSAWRSVLLALGLVLLTAGLALGTRGARDLGRANLTALPRPKNEGTLVETGVYRHVRHPLYVAVMLAGMGWALASASIPSMVAAIALVVWMDLKSRREEAWLIARFPSYAEYRRRTSRFVPRVY